MKTNRVSVSFMCSIAIMFAIFAPSIKAANITGDLFYTIYLGGPNVWRVSYTYDSTLQAFSLSPSVNLASTNGADGLVFDPTAADRLLIGGQGNNNLAQVKSTGTGGITGNETVGAAGQSYHLAVTPGNSTVWNMANGGSAFIGIVPLPFGTAGTSFAVTGDDTDIRGVAFIGTQGYYGTADDNGANGNFGTITFTGTQFVTHRLATGLPAHGLTYDPFTGNIMICAVNKIEQLAISGNTVTVVSTFATPAGPDFFDQTSVDGQGHLFAASLGGNLLFLDYSGTGKIGSLTNFSKEMFLVAGLDDIIPLSGLGGPISATAAFIEVCKSSSITNPVTGNFTFTATNGTFTSAPIVVPAGYCSGPIPAPAGTVTVTETPTTGVAVSAIKAFGYSPASIEGNLLITSDLTKGTAMVKVNAGDSSTETVVDFTNYEVPTGILEVCKDAAPGGPPVMGGFSFTVSGAPNNPYVLPAGACSGPIIVQAGSVTITEMSRAGFQLVDVDTIPVGRLVSTNIPGGSAVVTVAAGGVSSETVARFINGTVSPDIGQLKICKIAGPGIALGQTFMISANGVSFQVPAGPASQGGFCVFDGTFPAGTMVTVQEQSSMATPPAFQVLNIAVNPPDRISGTPDLVNGKTGVTIGTGFTEVTFTNIGSTPTGQLKICKVAGPGIAVGTNFTFTAKGSDGTQTFTVPAGPASEGGYCVVDGAFPLQTQVAVAEAPGSGVVTCVTVNGKPVGANGAPIAACTPIPNGMVPVTIGTGFTEVTFTNTIGGVIGENGGH